MGIIFVDKINFFCEQWCRLEWSMNDLNRSEKIKNYCFLNGQNTKPNNLKLLTIVQIFWISQTLTTCFWTNLKKTIILNKIWRKIFFSQKAHYNFWTERTILLNDRFVRNKRNNMESKYKFWKWTKFNFFWKTKKVNKMGR